MGYAVIINNVNTEMPQTKNDVQQMNSALEDIGFEVQIYNDLTRRVSIFI